MYITYQITVYTIMNSRMQIAHYTQAGLTTIEEIPQINSERKTNSEAQRMDSQRAARQGHAKAHSKAHRAPRAPPGAVGGRLGRWVLLRFRLTLAGRAANP